MKRSVRGRNNREKEILKINTILQGMGNKYQDDHNVRDVKRARSVNSIVDSLGSRTHWHKKREILVDIAMYDCTGLCIEHVLEHPDWTGTVRDHGDDIFTIAFRANKLWNSQCLLKKGARPQDEEVALVVASREPTEIKKDKIRFLLYIGRCDINAGIEVCAWDINPLITAIDGGNLEMVNFVLNCGARVNGYDRHPNFQYSPLVCAIRQSKGSTDIVQTLLDHGFDPNPGVTEILQFNVCNQYLIRWPLANILNTLLKSGGKLIHQGDRRNDTWYITHYNNVKALQILLVHRLRSNKKSSLSEDLIRYLETFLYK